MGSNQSQACDCKCDKEEKVDLNKLQDNNPKRKFKDGKEYITIGEKFEDPQKPLKNIMTDFVVDQFFKYESSLYLFLNLIVLLHEDALSNYRAQNNLKTHELFFVYKGGNIMRIIAKEFLLDLPENTTRKITAFYSPYFKRSDADFGIYLAPWVKNYDTHFSKITDLTYNVQIDIRKKILENPTKYLDFTKYNKTYQKLLLRDVLAQSNNEVKDKSIVFTDLIIGNVSANDSAEYKPNRDIRIDFADTKPDDYVGEREGVQTILSKHNNFMYISYNTALDFSTKTSEKWRSKFNLVRTKVGFNLNTESAVVFIGGELIDVSIPHRKDSELKLFFDDINDNLESFEINHEVCNFKFNSYSVFYLTKDLEKILFKQNTFPWGDEKYTKRINRVFYLYFVDIFMKVKGGKNRCQIISDIRDLIINPMKDNIEIDNRFIEKYDNINLAVNKLPYLLQNMLTYITDKDISNLSEMSEVMLVNVQFMIDTVENVKHYCLTDGKVLSEDIYQTSTSELI